ncbi:hypothetical protein NQ314_019363 [Rhamnusium bicolor]|uniref:PiggyBac transposable element-derived protein domain-containing protein n=1 Tax=Rhamnusium bicolor TaxID=1586634 RepID=A0AAV8WP83_9CUCU|nr:hypothetical protein NQ314_019363 [Rhamnusium bicolor]
MVYQGKDAAVEEKFQSFGLGPRVVLSLSEDYWGKNRIVYFDNYFSSLDLLEKLKAKNTLACGTIKSDRVGLPKQMKPDKEMTRGDIDYRVSKMDVTYCKWHDNRVVHLISNYHGTKSTTVKRMQKDGSRKDIACPEIVPDYNRYMGGVDRADRLRQAYCINRRSKKMVA